MRDKQVKKLTKKMLSSMTIDDFIKHVDTHCYGNKFICTDALSWLKGIGLDKPLRMAWDLCTRPQWMQWGVYLADSIYSTSAYDEDSNGRGYSTIHKLRKKYGWTWRGTQIWDESGVEDHPDDADLIRKHYNPFN